MIFFNKIVEGFIDPCKAYIENLDTDRRSVQQWRANITNLWTRMDFLRDLHHRLFAHDYSDTLYHHLFIDELFQCFPQALPGAQSKFLLLPSGDLVVWTLNETFTSLAPHWFDRRYLEVFRASQERRRYHLFRMPSRFEFRTTGSPNT